MNHSNLRRSALACALLSVLCAPVAAQAQSAAAAPDGAGAGQADAAQAGGADAAQASAGRKPTEIDKVTVTGSRIKRAEIEGPAPVFTITAAQIEKEGFNTVYDALTTLTEAMGTVESDIAWGQHTVNASPLNLRNMGPGRSLLLINGRRVVDYPLPYQGKSNFANYNNIPTAIVERIEVLASGASAIYGSDAVAGVINVILKKEYQGDQVKVRGGTSTRGGRDALDLSWAGGRSGDNWSVTYALQYFKREALPAGQREFMDSDFDAPPLSLNPQDRAVGILPSVGIRMLNAGTGQRLMPPAGACDQYSGEFFLQNRRTFNRNTGAITDTGWQCGQSAVFQHWTLRNGSEDRSGYLYGNYDFDNGMKGWASVGVWSSRGENMTFMPGWSSNGTYHDVGLNADLDLAKNFTPQEIGGAKNGQTRSDELSWDVAVGLSGKFGERFDWDFSVGRAEYRVDEKFPAILIAEGDRFFLGPNRDRLDQNRFWNPISPQDYASISTRGKNHAQSWLSSANFIVSGDLFEGWAGPIGFAGQLEAAKQGYRLAPDANTLGDDRLYDQTANLDRGSGSRNHYAAGVEFKIPLHRTLTASVAGRYDKYDAVSGDAATTYNAGLEWRPFSNLLLRGTYATSFRAPDMHFVYATPSTSVADQTDYLGCLSAGQQGNCTWDAGFKVEDAQIAREGTPDLKYETGKSWTVGFVWDIADGLSVSTDYWRIELEDEIDDIGANDVLLDEAYCLTGKTPTGEPRIGAPSADRCRLQIGRVTRGPDPDGAGPLLGAVTDIRTGPINRAARNVEGLDASLKYRLNTQRWGDFSFGLNYTNLLKLETRTDTSEQMQDKRTDEPRSKFRGSVNWQKERWNATVYADRVGSVPSVRFRGCRSFADGYAPNSDNCVDTDPASPTFGQQTQKYWGRVGPAITWNVSAGYRITDNAKVNVYVSNLFDEVNEDKDPYKRDFAFIADRIFSPVGREIAVEYVLDFK
ncbi:TonB-dependent Receptor Plug Domain [Lysobacter sp. yr284]|uniref:TonB-dependent receptor plug domain-containing protein n=1 Tax=Lysobacter sp. yr284 TaxID=1761791 RepID=UPI00089B7063|nr:TonB-dependent receptor [Lysobacter sp. yr284]SDY52802.1 TonB-dependent Receptor Plug Domain [Lysobacter sp. yr284]